jgi:hypothetical protein
MPVQCTGTNSSKVCQISDYKGKGDTQRAYPLATARAQPLLLAYERLASVFSLPWSRP